MLGKLFKYEFKNTYKLMFIIYGVMAFVTILGCIAMYGDSDPAGTENQLQEIFFTAAMVFYVLGVFALFVVSYVYMCVHFYKTMYSDQGYLTHTLPVGQMSIFNVKLLVSLCWLMLSLIKRSNACALSSKSSSDVSNTTASSACRKGAAARVRSFSSRRRISLSTSS